MSDFGVGIQGANKAFFTEELGEFVGHLLRLLA